LDVIEGSILQDRDGCGANVGEGPRLGNGSLDVKRWGFFYRVVSFVLGSHLTMMVMGLVHHLHICLEVERYGVGMK
jgi:hypothetical protein